MRTISASRSAQTETTSVTWVNHASMVVESGSTRLLVDPWFTGSVFDDGWDLLCETPSIDLGALTDIWVSHEHPDHFHPPTLRSIDSSVRAHTRFWYQATRDGKVATYARALGFGRVTECRRGRRYELSPGVTLRVEPWGVFDSILVLETPDGTIVDLNDCKTRDALNAECLAHRLHGITADVLITQVEAGDDVDMLVEQVEALQARTVIPGASFVWFSHQENARHNETATHIDRAWRRLQDRVTAEVIVLYPGDQWEIGTAHDTAASLRRYAADYARVAAERPRHAAVSIPEEQLRLDAAQWGSRLRSYNGARVLRWLRSLGALEPARVWVTDHHRAYALSSDGLDVIDAAPGTCDAILSSSALDAVFRFPWGGNTLLVNGRLNYPPHGRPARFRRWTSMSSYNNHGYRIGQMLPRLASDAVRRRLTNVAHPGGS